MAPPAQKPPEASPPPAPVIKALHEEDADTPLGDWQTENKGVVRIAQCGKALCGYTLNPSSDDKGEAVLINMKPKTDTRWTGNVYSKDSGDTYYGTVDLKGPNTLHVEACAFGRFYCSGNNWIRISAKPMMTSRQTSSQPRRVRERRNHEMNPPIKTPGGLTAGPLVQICCPDWTGSAFRTRRARWLRRRRMRHRR